MRVLAPSEQHMVVRSEILGSWLRCQRSGLSPEAELNVSRLHEVDRGSRLMAAAAPVLDALARHLEGTGFSLLLADSSGRLVDMRCGAPVVRARVERSGAVIGQLFSESATGTNAISTALELRHGLFVRAGEHFLEGLKSYSCYGQPIFNRATRRLEGVLDISCAPRTTTNCSGPSSPAASATSRSGCSRPAGPRRSGCSTRSRTQPRGVGRDWSWCWVRASAWRRPPCRRCSTSATAS